MIVLYIILGILALVFILKVAANSSNIETPDNVTEEDVKQFMRDGKKIHAIKCYRQITGMGLKDAKDAVERMEL
ncbi:ribosomal protein L7/L12 [Lentisphaera profundi]|uniref:Ribosomal protein L7/L12 n=1 Tax=Lentisphaera profundi TaxID=1658616 RepID=A0ABY7VSJ4_9BACT|nr:ribosomal protein L7/L12 [Lentisphaera profundi]WDE96871.1 ribosomal protein L7/L12 [Lentisphaera profundi]